MSVRFGLGLFTAQVPRRSDRTFAREYAETLELVRLAESSGFDSVWVSEHHGSSDGYLPSLLTLLAAFAAVTERVSLGTGVVLAPLHDPLRLAEDAAVVDQISDGRLRLGLGAGWREEEFRMFGVPLAERGHRVEETVEILRRAWTGERFSFEGRAYRCDRVRVTPRPARQGGPPIYLGGYVGAAVRRAGRLADGFITDDAGPAELERSVATLDAAARDAGREPPGLALLQNVALSTDGDALAPVREGIQHQLGAYEAWANGADTPDLDELVVTPMPEDEIARWTPHGTPADLTEALRPTLERFGGEREVEVVVRLHYPGMDLEPAARAVELFAREVIPSFAPTG